MQRKVIKTGHSLAVTLPGNLLKDLALKVGDVVELELKNEQIVIKKSKSRHQLDLGLKLRPRL